MSKIEDRILAVVMANAELAITEEALKVATGLRGLSFKEALSRLIEKQEVVRWKTERFVNYVVAAQYAHQAHYFEEVATYPLAVLFGGSGVSVVRIERSIPFVMLDDAEIRKSKRNRYREQDWRDVT